MGGSAPPFVAKMNALASSLRADQVFWWSGDSTRTSWIPPAEAWVKTGPRRNWNFCVVRSKIETPTMSAGSMSLVNCRRDHSNPSTWASVCASVVLPTPGTSSISR